MIGSVSFGCSNAACLCTGNCKKFPYTCNGNLPNPLNVPYIQPISPQSVQPEKPRKKFICEGCAENNKVIYDLKKQLKSLTDMYMSVSIQCAANHEHKLNQIKENRNLKEIIMELAESMNARLTKLESKVDKDLDDYQNVYVGIVGCSDR